MANGGRVQEDAVISKFYEHLCFDLLIKDNDVEIAELIISVCQIKYCTTQKFYWIGTDSRN